MADLNGLLFYVICISDFIDDGFVFIFKLLYAPFEILELFFEINFPFSFGVVDLVRLFWVHLLGVFRASGFKLL